MSMFFLEICTFFICLHYSGAKYRCILRTRLENPECINRVYLTYLWCKCLPCCRTTFAWTVCAMWRCCLMPCELQFKRLYGVNIWLKYSNTLFGFSFLVSLFSINLDRFQIDVSRKNRIRSLRSTLYCDIPYLLYILW